jgi:hypothetical protein
VFAMEDQWKSDRSPPGKLVVRGENQTLRLTLSSPHVDDPPAKSRRTNRACLSVGIYLLQRQSNESDC